MSDFRFSNNVQSVRQMVDGGRPKRFHKRIVISVTDKMYLKLRGYARNRNQSKVVREAIQQYFERNATEPETTSEKHSQAAKGKTSVINSLVVGN